jgi:endonuclease/exonuclease/phosphatase family metal-dependent hydrolase
MMSRERRQYLLDQLNRHKTIADLRRSAFYTDCASEIESLLNTPELFHCQGARPRLSAFVRAVQWNLEKGKQYEAVVRQFETDPVMRSADIVLLNEADCGMIRSGNRHVARRLAEALGMNVAFAPACLELTKGIGDEQWITGENRESMQGNAVLSRFPILTALVIRLPQCFEPYEFPEKRYGGRNCLWVNLHMGASSLWVGSTHLEVRNTPGCRATQMKQLMAALPGDASEPRLLGGDLNTNCLRRGTRRRALSTVARLLLTDPGVMKRRFLSPQRSEPLFRVAARARFLPQGFNSAEATTCAPVEGSEDITSVPAIFRDYVKRRAEPYQESLHMKLDWFLGRGIVPLRAGEVLDPASGAASRDPACVPTRRTGWDRISDHSPIFADFRFP